MIFVGIDPGLQGYMALFKDNSEWPSIKKLSQGLDFYFDMVNLHSVSDGLIICIEKQISMGHDAHNSLRTGAYNYGRIIMGLDLLVHEFDNIKYSEVHPASWKSYYKIKGKDKTASKKSSCDIVKLLFGKAGKELITGKRGAENDNIAEAILIAEYGRQTYNRKLYTGEIKTIRRKPIRAKQLILF